ncbi:MAG: substrate-binding domain-containing protein [Myxococcaceae bacterium]
MVVPPRASRRIHFASPGVVWAGPASALVLFVCFWYFLPPLLEYLSTAELAKLLKLHQKKVYAMAAAGQLPAVRVSGKWLFPKELVERWLEQHTVYPASGLMGALLDQMLVLQGSDDWLLSRVVERVQAKSPFPIAATAVGSIGGLQALAGGHAHLASCHVDPSEVRKQVGGPAYLVELAEREQGLIFDPARTPAIHDLRSASDRGLRFASRQPRSGTALLVRRLLREAQLEPAWTEVGPFSSHLELALAIRNAEADVGVGIHIAAQKAGLAFVALSKERFSLAVPAQFFSHARVMRFLDQAITALRAECAGGLPGYSIAGAGRLEPIGACEVP